MVKITPISKKEHLKFSYKGLSNYLHTQNDSTVPILAAELNRVIHTNPIVFMEDPNLGYGIYSLQSLIPSKNLMIDANGTWLSDYIPARYRSLPFVLARETGKESSDDKLLCFVDSLECVSSSFTENSTKIFDENSELSEDMQRVFTFLKSIEQNTILTKKAVDSIVEADIFQDWTISLKLKDGERDITGLKKIDNEKFAKLSGETLENLNKTAGLDICYASSFSLENIEKLKQFALDTVSKKSPAAPNDKSSMSLRDLTLEKQKQAEAKEMDSLVKNLLLDD
jgi:hypothetical protein